MNKVEHHQKIDIEKELLEKPKAFLNDRTKDIFTKMNAFKAILIFSIPAVIGMLIQGSYTFVDKIIVTTEVGVIANSGLLVAEQLIQIVFGFAILISTGAGAYFSVSLGRKKYEDAKKALGSAMYMSIVVGLLSTLFLYFFHEPIITGLGAKPGQLAYGKEYLYVVIWGMPFYLMGTSLLSFLRAEGKTKFSAIVIIISALSNITIDVILVFGLKMGVTGAAIATLFGGYMVTFIAPIIYIMRAKETKLKFNFFNIKYVGKAVVIAIVIFGLPTFIRNAGQTMQGIIQTSVLTDMPLPDPSVFPIDWVDFSESSFWHAVNAGFLPTFALLILPIVGIIQGTFPLIGYNIGKKDPKRVKDIFVASTVFQLAYATVISIIWWFFGGIFLEAFQVPAVFNDIIRYSVLLLPVFALTFQVSLYYQSTARPVRAILTGNVRNVFLLIPLYYILKEQNSAEEIFKAPMYADIIALFIMGFIYIRVYKKLSDGQI